MPSTGRAAGIIAGDDLNSKKIASGNQTMYEQEFAYGSKNGQTSVPALLAVQLPQQAAADQGEGAGGLKQLYSWQIHTPGREPTDSAIKPSKCFSSNNTVNDTSNDIHLFQLVVYSPMFILGLIINSAILWMLCFKIKKWTASTIYMINLIISDISVLLSLPFKVYANYVGEGWRLGWTFCKLLEFLYYVNTYASILLITCICMDRYIAIRYPFLARTIRSPKKTVVICIVIWIILGIESRRIYVQRILSICFSQPPIWNMDIILFSQMVFLISAFIMVLCSIQMIRLLRTSGPEKAENDFRNKSVKIIISNVLIFFLCFTPCHVSMLLETLIQRCLISEKYWIPVHKVYQISLCLAKANCCLDAVYYYFVIKEFWERKGKQKQSNTN
uniref:G-protein coupled receptor 35-like n=1 Tax=Pristiophorus japonicus TaxID=55135 RepID=UPI00398F36C5